MRWIVATTLFSFVLAGCLLSDSPVGDPPAGWDVPVSELLLGDSVIPNGMLVDFPEDTLTDPAVNKVTRTWGGGVIIQAIWRSYTVQDAQEKYEELQLQYSPTPPSLPHQVFVPFETPEEVHFKSRIADEFRIGCGWDVFPFCLVAARYQNYVVQLHLLLIDEEIGEIDQTSQGLTYQEIDKLLMDMEGEFVKFFEALSDEE